MNEQNQGVPPQPQKPDNPPASDRYELWKGLGLLFLFHLIWFLYPMGGGFIGLTQALYAVPAYIWANSKGRPRFAQGILIGVGVTFLLNSACWGALLLIFNL